MRLDVHQSGGGFGGDPLPMEERLTDRSGDLPAGSRGGDVIVVLLCLAVLAGMGFILWKVSPDGFGLFKQPESFGMGEPAIRITPSLRQVLDRVAEEKKADAERSKTVAKTPADRKGTVRLVAAARQEPVRVTKKSPVVVKKSGVVPATARRDAAKGSEAIASEIASEIASAVETRTAQTMAPGVTTAKASLAGVRPMVSKSGAVVITPAGNRVTPRGAKGGAGLVKGA